MGKNSPPRWTEDQLHEWLQRRGQPTASSSPPGPKKTARKTAHSIDGQPPKRKPRRGIEVKPLVEALNNCHPKVALDRENGTLSILFDGVRLLSVNNLLSILPFRPYEVFRYKKAWHKAVERALMELGPVDWRQVFPCPVQITFFRRAPKSYDLDSPITPFKYALDGLVKHKYMIGDQKYRGVIVDDNRKYVPEMKEAFAKGPAGVGIRIERCPEPPPVLEIEPYQDWFNEAPPE